MTTNASIIVPTRNSQRTLAACLTSLQSQFNVEVEVIVVDNYSTDATQTIAERLGARLIVAGPERSTQRNIGLNEARNDIVVFVDSDMVLEPNVVSETTYVLRADHLAAVVIPERSFGTNFWASVKAHEKLLVEGNPLVEAARGFRRDELKELGGWDESMFAAEDWELTDRYAAAGAAFFRTRSMIWHDEGSPSLYSLYAKKRYYGSGIGQYAELHPQRASRMWRRYSTLDVMPHLVRRPLLTAGLATCKMAELIGARTGSWQAKPASREQLS